MSKRALYAFAHGTALPSTAGLPEGYPFVWDHGGGLATLYTLTAGVWREAAVPNLRDLLVTAHGGASAGAILAAHWGLTGALAGHAAAAGAVTPVFTPVRADGIAVVSAALVRRLGLSSLGPAGLGAVVAALTASSPAFSDNFNRTDRTLNGDNGWINSTGTAMGFGVGVAPYSIASNQVRSNASSDADPILHTRGGASGVADLTITHSFAALSGSDRVYLYVCSDLGNANSLRFVFTGTAGFHDIQRHIGGDDVAGHWSITTQTAVNGGWSAWSFGTSMVIRVVYTEATKTLDVYQNGTQKITCSTADSNWTDAGAGEMPALTTMPYVGFSLEDNDRVDDLVCA